MKYPTMPRCVAVRHSRRRSTDNVKRIDYVLDVPASNPEEINLIAARLKQPSSELLDWVAKKQNCKPDRIAQSLTELVSFEPTKNLFYIHESVNKARRFENSFKRYTGIVDSHLLEVSGKFPNAVFLLEYFDTQWSYSGKMVIHAGQVVQRIFDGKHQSQAVDWVLLDIFAPFRAEWCEGLKVGSLWAQWVKDVATAVEELRKTAVPATFENSSPREAFQEEIQQKQTEV